MGGRCFGTRVPTSTQTPTAQPGAGQHSEGGDRPLWSWQNGDKNSCLAQGAGSGSVEMGPQVTWAHGNRVSWGDQASKAENLIFSPAPPLGQMVSGMSGLCHLSPQCILYKVRDNDAPLGVTEATSVRHTWHAADAQ